MRSRTRNDSYELKILSKGFKAKDIGYLDSDVFIISVKILDTHMISQNVYIFNPQPSIKKDTYNNIFKNLDECLGSDLIQYYLEEIYRSTKNSLYYGTIKDWRHLPNKRF